MTDFFLKSTDKAALLVELSIEEMNDGIYQDENFILDYIGIIKTFDDEGNVIQQSDSDRLNIRTFNPEFSEMVLNLTNAEPIVPPEVPYRIFS